MKGSVLTTKTWFLLIGAALLISAGLLNFRQRARHETPPWDGVEWVDTNEGIIAKSIERGSAADRAWLLPGDRLIGISLDGKQGRADRRAPATCRSISIRPSVGGQLHYLMKRPSYPPEIGAYWADLDNLGAIHKWTPRVIYINLIGVVYLFVGFFVLFKQGGRAPFVLHFATFCLAAFVFLFYTPVGSYRRSRSGDRVSRQRRIDSLSRRCSCTSVRSIRRGNNCLPTRRWRAVLLYVPALLLLGFAVVVFLRDETGEGRFGLSRTFPSRNNSSSSFTG